MNTIRAFIVGIRETRTDFTTSNMWGVPAYEVARTWTRRLLGIE